MMGFAANAANITLYLDDKTVEPGSTTIFNDIETTDLGGYYEVEMKPDFQMASDANVSGVTVVATCTTPGQQIQLCCGGQCEVGTSVTKQGISLSKGAKLPLEFHYMGDADTLDEIPTITATLAISYEGKTDNYNVVMNDKSGVSVVAADKDAFVSGRTLIYNVATPSAAVVYYANGAVAMSASVAGNGSLDLSNLPAGLYICRVGKTSVKVML